MRWDLLFFANSALLGVGLAMDAFSVSVANGLHEPNMRGKRMCLMAGVYAFFQFLMPVIGWICVHTLVQHFRTLERFVPWVALALLLFLGIRMVLEGVRCGDGETECPALSGGTLLVQGIATSIDALSVGLTLADYDAPMALAAALIIAAVTFVICMGGLRIGRTVGMKLAGKAPILGGIILILIGIEIFVKGVFFS